MCSRSTPRLFNTAVRTSDLSSNGSYSSPVVGKLFTLGADNTVRDGNDTLLLIGATGECCICFYLE